MRNSETASSRLNETLRRLGSSVINFEKIRRKLRVRKLLGDLVKLQLSLDGCVELFSSARLDDWYGPGKEKTVRQPWAQRFGDLFAIASDEARGKTISRLSELPPYKQIDFLVQLFELDPPRGERDDGNRRQLLAQALWQRLDEGEQREFVSAMRASPAVPLEIKESFGIFPPAESRTITIGAASRGAVSAGSEL